MKTNNGRLAVSNKPAVICHFEKLLFPMYNYEIPSFQFNNNLIV